MRTTVSERLGITYPIIQGPLGPMPAADLVAAVCRAGALGSVAAVERSPENLAHEVRRIREQTDRPFAVNHLLTRFNPATFELTIELRPPVISFALGDPGDLVQRARDTGAVVMQQVHTVEQGRRAAELQVDIIIAQGSEAGGNAGQVSTLVLVPQVVDAVRPIPVVAAGGIADGRGFAAALMLGAAGINLGTRFLASTEALVGLGWKEGILRAQSEDVLPVDFWYDIFPRSERGYGNVLPRAIRTEFIDSWQQQRETIPAHAQEIRELLLQAAATGRMHEYVPLAGQSAGMVREILPAGEIVRRLVAEAQEVLTQSANWRQQ